MIKITQHLDLQIMIRLYYVDSKEVWETGINTLIIIVLTTLKITYTVGQACLFSLYRNLRAKFYILHITLDRMPTI